MRGDRIQPHLPEEPNSFIGRERELDELRRLVYSTRALTLAGPGGIGKTRLALRLLGSMTAEFPDGAWFVELADLRRPDLVVSRLAAVVGVSEEPGRPLLDTLADVLRSRRMLLALDNCEHLIDACAEVAGRLLASSPGLRLLMTSREPLRLAAETVWRVPPLAVPPPPGPSSPGTEPPGTAPPGTGDGVRSAFHDEAVRLFADRAAAVRPGFAVGPDNAADVAAICRALDGLPLAIELAAARIGVLSVEQIGARLGDRFALLTTGDRSAAPRHRTLRATIEWSYEMLTTAERTLFRRLSLFAGWSLEMAEQVCADGEVPAGDMLALTAALVDKSLVMLEPEVLGQARYRMLDSIREFAAALLADAGEVARFRLALRDYTLRTAEHHLAVGMAKVPVPWSARVELLPPVHRRRRQREPGAGLVPGRWRRGDRAADLHRGQPALDRVGYLRRGRRVARFLPGPCRHRRAVAADPRRRPGRPGAAGGGQRPRRRAEPGRGRSAAVPGRRRPVLDRERAEPAERDRPAHRAGGRGDRPRGPGARHRAGRRRRLERGLRAGHQRRDRGPGGTAHRGKPAGRRLGQRDAAHRPAVGRRPRPDRPRRPGPAARSSGRGAFPLRGGAGDPA